MWTEALIFAKSFGVQTGNPRSPLFWPLSSRQTSEAFQNLKVEMAMPFTRDLQLPDKLRSYCGTAPNGRRLYLLGCWLNVVRIVLDQARPVFAKNLWIPRAISLVRKSYLRSHLSLKSCFALVKDVGPTRRVCPFVPTVEEWVVYHSIVIFGRTSAPSVITVELPVRLDQLNEVKLVLVDCRIRLV